MIFATDQVPALHELAPEVEARGFESLWVTEKTHVPVSRRTPWPGGSLPEWYKRTCDPFVALGAAAAVTRTLRLGTGVTLPAARDPVVLAKEVATLDWLSSGRVELGVGYGWNAEELASHGVELADARAVTTDRVQLLQSLWASDIAGYEGQWARVEPCWSWPKPAQHPRPPIHLGARATQEVFDDIATWGDGWLPIEGYGTITNQVPRLRAAFERAGRDPDDAIVSVYSSAGDPRQLDSYRAAGVHRVVLALPSNGTDSVIDALDRLTPVLTA